MWLSLGQYELTVREFAEGTITPSVATKRFAISKHGGSTVSVHELTFTDLVAAIFTVVCAQLKHTKII